MNDDDNDASSLVHYYKSFMVDKSGEKHLLQRARSAFSVDSSEFSSTSSKISTSFSTPSHSSSMPDQGSLRTNRNNTACPLVVLHYSRAIDFVLEEQSSTNSNGSSCIELKVPLKACFNCGDPNHSVQECTEKRDFNRIAENRQAFMESKSPRTQLEGRYFSEDPKSQFRYGFLSEALKSALGMSEGEPPPFLERMQWFGPPPAYFGPRASLKYQEEEKDRILLFYGDSNEKKKKSQAIGEDSDMDIGE